MSTISAILSDEYLAKVDTIAGILSESYGVPVSRSEIIRRAIAAFPMPPRSRDLSIAPAATVADSAGPGSSQTNDRPPHES